VVPENSQSQEVDLDRTDRLPILEGTSVDADVADDAVRLDYSPVAKSVKSEFRRPPPADLPSLAESVRSVEERIARRNSDYEALTRSHEKARAAEAEAASRTAGLASDLAAARAAADLAQTRLEDALGEAERGLVETRTLRNTVAARDANIAQLQRSLAERDAQLSALQREHAQIVPSLEERSSAAVQLAADLRAARARLESVTADLDHARQAMATLTAQLNRGDEELQATRSELNGAKAQAAAHLERLRTREFRRALDESGATPIDHRALLSERELKVQELERTCADLHEKLNAGNIEAQRGKEMLSAAEHSRADLALNVLHLRAEGQEREEQMEVLLAHLQEARRLTGQVNSEVKRPPESTDANAAERSQPDDGGAAPASEYAVDLIRIDGSHHTAHALGRRTRIGRAPGCEIHIESSSVSRHHALVLMNSRDVIIEDLRSTNGVLVNGRKVTRQLLTDGDIVTVGDAQLRLRVKPGPRQPEAAEPSE
jgi:hypothetical protein